MGKIAQFVMGPAGSGKSTYCNTLMTHAHTVKRNIHLFNLDPAADPSEFQASIDIKDLISLDDVQEDLEFGPNGGLIYCLEYLMENIDWLVTQLQDMEDDNLIVDCPGQIELFTHSNLIQQLIKELEHLDYRVCGVFLLDAGFMLDSAKFFAGVMAATTCMLQTSIPHINVLSKVDLLDEESKKQLDRFLNCDSSILLDDANTLTNKKFHALNRALVQLIDEYNMVSFIPLDINDEESIEYLQSVIDVCVQYGEDLEPKEVVEDFDKD